MDDEARPSPVTVSGNEPQRGADAPRRQAPLASYAAWVVAATLASAAVPLWSRMQYELGVWAVLPALVLVLVAGHATDARVRRISAALALVVSGFVLLVVVRAGLALVYQDVTGPDLGIGRTSGFRGWEVDTPMFALSLAGAVVLVVMSAWELLGRSSRR